MTERIDFEPLANSGLTQKEFADLCGVSRVTVNLWARGKMQPHLYIKDRVSGVVDALAEAIQAGKLPIGKDWTPEMRKAAINSLNIDRKVTV